jgi:hypothetical protein
MNLRISKKPVDISNNNKKLIIFKKSYFQVIQIIAQN